MSLSVAALLLVAGQARAEGNPSVASPPNPPPSKPGPVQPEALDLSLSPECRVPGSKLYTLAKLSAVKDALAEKRTIRVLSIGSSSAGLGATASYPVRLESALKRSLKSVDVDVESRGLPGEIASDATERLRAMVAEVEPDLVIWQVGANDALARVDIDAFGRALENTVHWLKSHDIDIVLIDPLFTESLADDAYYSELVGKVQAVAAATRVPLVRRYESMRFLASVGEEDDAHMFGENFRLNDLGQRCMAEHVTRAITLSLVPPAPVVGKEAAPQRLAPPNPETPPAPPSPAPKPEMADPGAPRTH